MPKQLKRSIDKVMFQQQNNIFLPDKFRDPFSFEEIINLYDNLLKKKSVLDFSQVGFVEPYSMLAFLIFGKAYLRNTGEILELRNLPMAIHQYLMRMDFFNFNLFVKNEELDKRLYLKRKSSSSRLIEIIEIPSKEKESITVISNIIKVFRNKAKNILRHWFDETTVDYFVTVISEIGQNIFEHSLDSGYFTIQTYNTDRETVLKLVIADSGIGIIKSFEKKSDLTWENQTDLLKDVLTTPLSSKRRFGYGLCQVHSIIEKLKGSVYIRSENASLAVMYNRRKENKPYYFYKNSLAHFPGTQIAITLTS